MMRKTAVEMKNSKGLVGLLFEFGVSLSALAVVAMYGRPDVFFQEWYESSVVQPWTKFALQIRVTSGRPFFSHWLSLLTDLFPLLYLKEGNTPDH